VLVHNHMAHSLWLMASDLVALTCPAAALTVPCHHKARSGLTRPLHAPMKERGAGENTY
jgi:hypothetical protein